MSGFWSFITGAVSDIGASVVKLATPSIFGSLVGVLEGWHKDCLATPNKWDDVFSGGVLKVATALAGTPEAQADPDADGGDDGDANPDPASAPA